MNRYRFAIFADLRITDPDQYVGFWKSKKEWFWCQDVEGFKKHNKISGKSEDWVVLRGFSKPIDVNTWAVPAAAPLAQMKSEFIKTDERPAETAWRTYSYKTV